MRPFVPRRRRGSEILDDPAVSARVVDRSMVDVARANALLGGTRAVLAELAPVLAELRHRSATLVDVGSGLGDIAAVARADAARRGVTLAIWGVEVRESLARTSRARGLPMICADARALPVRDGAVDVVVCSQLLHHFDREEAVALLREVDRVARHRVIVADLRRSWLAAAGIWLASFPLRFHPVSRHDGLVSVLRGFRAEELHALVEGALRLTPRVRNRAGFRVTASWRPSHARAAAEPFAAAGR